MLKCYSHTQGFILPVSVLMLLKQRTLCCVMFAAVCHKSSLMSHVSLLACDLMSCDSVMKLMPQCVMSRQDPCVDLCVCVFVQASLSEIHSNMWVRNGLQIKGQAMTYVQSHFCNSMIDPDIYLLQVTC